MLEGWKDKLKSAAKIIGISAMATLGAHRSSSASSVYPDTDVRGAGSVAKYGKNYGPALQKVDDFSNALLDQIADIRMENLKSTGLKPGQVGGHVTVDIDIDEKGNVAGYHYVSGKKDYFGDAKAIIDQLRPVRPPFGAVSVKVDITMIGEYGVDREIQRRQGNQESPYPTGTDRWDDSDAFSSLQNSLYNTINTYFFYPKEAEKAGEEGVVTVEMDIKSLKKGEVNNFKIISSPSPALSKAVTDMISKAIESGAISNYGWQRGQNVQDSGVVRFGIEFDLQHPTKPLDTTRLSEKQFGDLLGQKISAMIPKNGPKGKVGVRFVWAEGQAVNAEVTKSSGNAGLDKKALEILEMLPHYETKSEGKTFSLNVVF